MIPLFLQSHTTTSLLLSFFGPGKREKNPGKTKIRCVREHIGLSYCVRRCEAGPGVASLPNDTRHLLSHEPGTVSYILTLKHASTYNSHYVKLNDKICCNAWRRIGLSALRRLCIKINVNVNRACPWNLRRLGTQGGLVTSSLCHRSNTARR